ncbi:MAG: hypothetical protein QM775_06485 [Pirellulales bacterium]
MPGSLGQNLAVLDGFEHTPTGVKLIYRNGPYLLSQIFEPITDADGRGSGFRRTVEIETAGYDNTLRTLRNDERPSADLRLFSVDEKLFQQDGRAIVANSLAGKPRIEVLERSGIAEPQQTSLLAFAGSSPGDKVVRFVVAYTSSLPVDTFPTDIPAMPNPPTVNIGVVPGFDGLQLPLGIAEMPTGLAWKADGTLMITSLKGRVIEAKDTNADGLEDALRPVSDDLAAPYGIAVAEEDGKEVLDVVNKYALLRLFDDDGDGYYERNVVAAGGWGHTEDYHDWAVGLPRIPAKEIDGKLGYYVGLPCQQDNRSEAKAALRGQGLRLIRARRRRTIRGDSRWSRSAAGCAFRWAWP